MARPAAGRTRTTHPPDPSGKRRSCIGQITICCAVVLQGLDFSCGRQRPSASGFVAVYIKAQTAAVLPTLPYPAPLRSYPNLSTSPPGRPRLLEWQSCTHFPGRPSRQRHCCQPAHTCAACAACTCQRTPWHQTRPRLQRRLSWKHWSWTGHGGGGATHRLISARKTLKPCAAQPASPACGCCAWTFTGSGPLVLCSMLWFGRTVPTPCMFVSNSV